MDKAAEAGFPCPAQLFLMTPKQVEWELTAFAARRRREIENIDALAWLTGQYAAIGVHAPKKYPKRPGSEKSERVMSDEEMKRALLNLAGRSEVE